MERSEAQKGAQLHRKGGVRVHVSWVLVVLLFSILHSDLPRVCVHSASIVDQRGASL